MDVVRVSIHNKISFYKKLSIIITIITIIKMIK